MLSYQDNWDGDGCFCYEEGFLLTGGHGFHRYTIINYGSSNKCAGSKVLSSVFYIHTCVTAYAASWGQVCVLLNP